MSKRPAFQFYPADWRKDNELQSCSIGARGLCIEMMCLAHECDPYGYLMVNGRPMTDEQIMRRVGAPRGFAGLLDELLSAGVVKRDEKGAIFFARMVKDEATRLSRATGGQLGAEHGVKGAEHGKKGGRPKADKGASKPPLKPAPSSSTSSSSSTSVKEVSLREPELIEPFEVPPWLPAQTWEAYIDMRKRIRKPLTDHAKALALSKLEKFRADGQDPVAIIEQAIMGSYQGLFPVKQDGIRNGTGDRGSGKSGASTAHQRHLEGLAMLVDEEDRRAESLSGRQQLALPVGDDGEQHRRSG